jgi:DNA-binding transcriptional regulator YiaG
MANVNSGFTGGKHMKIPSPQEILNQRELYQLAQTSCAKVMDISERQWRRYETGENEMSSVQWAYFLHPDIWPKT